MPLIKARTRGKQLVRHITRFDRETNETLYAYAHFLGEPTEYVLDQLVDTMLAKDKEFVAWRAERPSRTSPGERRTGLGPRGAVPTAEPDRCQRTFRLARPEVGRWRSGVIQARARGGTNPCCTGLWPCVG